MAINTGQLHIEATDKVLAALTELYKDTEPDPDAMRGFAEAIASIAVATAEHFIARAETVQSGEGIH
ncbi:MAG: hypothetical protein WD397_17335 [Wenzhouxiangellaceae bacterium]